MPLTDDEATLRARLAANLRAAREAAGLTQSQVAHELRIGEMQPSRWELGNATPHAVMLYRLTALLGVSMDSLFEEVAAPTANLNHEVNP